MWQKIKQFLKQKALPMILMDGIEIFDNLQSLDINDDSVLILTTKMQLSREEVQDISLAINTMIPNRVLILDGDIQLSCVLNPEPKKDAKNEA
jgi:hypothetical protein